MLEKFLDCDPLVDVHDEAVLEKVATDLCDLSRELRRFFCRGNHLHYALGVVPVLNPRGLARDHFDYATAKRPYVGRLATALSLHNLRCHPVRRTFDLAIACA